MTAYLPSLKQLQYLIALKEHGHFGRAAAACFVTQSTLSAGLRELEKLIGLTLVERNRRIVRFTPAGDIFVAKARRVVREAEELGDLARASGEPLSGELSMSVIPTIAPFLLPRVLPRLRAQYPALKLFLREEPSAPACEALNRGRVDCVLLALPFACGEVVTRRLFRDPLMAAFPAAEAPPAGSIAPAMIENSRLLLLEDGHCLTDHALSACARPGHAEKPTMLGTSLHTIVQMVGNGLGLTIVPRMAVAAGILEGADVSAHPLDSAAAYREIALVWRKSSPRQRDFQLLAGVMIAAEREAAEGT